MNLWRSLVALTVVVGLLFIIGTTLPVGAGEKDKDQKDKMTKEKKDGNWVVTQKIEAVTMKIDIGGNVISYDGLKEQPANPMTEFFNALKKLALTLTIGPDMKVKNIEGREEFIKKLSETNPQM